MVVPQCKVCGKEIDHSEGGYCRECFSKMIEDRKNNRNIKYTREQRSSTIGFTVGSFIVAAILLVAGILSFFYISEGIGETIFSVGLLVIGLTFYYTIGDMLSEKTKDIILIIATILMVIVVIVTLFTKF